MTALAHCVKKMPNRLYAKRRRRTLKLSRPITLRCAIELMNMTIREKAFQQSRPTAVLSLLLGLIMIASMLDDTPTSVDSVAGDPFSATVVDLGLYRDARRLGQDRHTEETWFRARTGHHSQ